MTNPRSRPVPIHGRRTALALFALVYLTCGTVVSLLIGVVVAVRAGLPAGTIPLWPTAVGLALTGASTPAVTEWLLARRTHQSHRPHGHDGERSLTSRRARPAQPEPEDTWPKSGPGASTVATRRTGTMIPAAELPDRLAAMLASDNLPLMHPSIARLHIGCTVAHRDDRPGGGRVVGQVDSVHATDHWYVIASWVPEHGDQPHARTDERGRRVQVFTLDALMVVGPGAAPTEGGPA